MGGQNANQGDPQKLVQEIQICFATAGGCAAFGIAGLAIQLGLHIPNDLQAFLVVSAVYALMGIGAVYRLARVRLAEKRNAPPNHQGNGRVRSERFLDPAGSKDG